MNYVNRSQTSSIKQTMSWIQLLKRKYRPIFSALHYLKSTKQVIYQETTIVKDFFMNFFYKRIE